MKEIIIYTTRKCAKCKRIKSWMHRNRIAFVEKDLGNTDVMTDLVMRNLTVLSSPVLEVNGHVFLSHEIFLDNSSLNPSFKQFLRGEKS